MLSRPRENLRRRLPRARSWLIPAALLALTPKCIACVLGYAGLGAMLGLGGPELCGTSGNHSGLWIAFLIPAGAAAFLARPAIGASRPSRPEPSEKVSLNR
ncbi:MAG TPA: hypothetical protein VIK52_08260 [Opitutaceae bacterium]